jgi:uncharacterized protein (TIGR03435 family)
MLLKPFGRSVLAMTLMALGTVSAAQNIDGGLPAVTHTAMPQPQSAASDRPSEFDVVSIKRNRNTGDASGGTQSLPDGTWMMVNQPIAVAIPFASPVPVREVAELPGWVKEERYDITVKPPAGSTREEVAAMWRKTFAQRMNLVAHVEQREINGFALVPARSDGRLGPQLKSAPPECQPSQASANPAAAPKPVNQCGLLLGANGIQAVGVTFDNFVGPLSGLAGGLVVNRTGLTGAYELRLDIESPDLRATGDASGVDTRNVFTAVREQLGLKLDPEKILVPVLVVDAIQRPSEN